MYTLDFDFKSLSLLTVIYHSFNVHLKLTYSRKLSVWWFKVTIKSNSFATLDKKNTFLILEFKQKIYEKIKKRMRFREKRNSQKILAI
jgi:hypothetical protein